MHIDWNGIKQRPHFLADELSADYEITLLYLKAYKRSFLTTNPLPLNITIQPLHHIPSKLIRYSFFRKINELFLRLQCKYFLLKDNFDFLWLTSPFFLKPVLPYLGKSLIIYDCMDDAIGIEDQELRSAFINDEKKLLEIAQVVFVTSSVLQKSVKEKNMRCDPFVVRNGISDSFIRQMQDRRPYRNQNMNKNFRFLYIGTVSYWFDYKAVKRLITTYPQCSLDIIGPVEKPFPNEEGINFLGVYPHHELPETAQKYNALLMPFFLSDFILSVDPVKLYEYISFEKNILARKYKEIERFEPYVLFYETTEDLIEKASSLIKNNELKYNKESARDFLFNNSWKERAVTIKNALELKEILA